MGNIARFVVDTHSHSSTLYMPKGEESMKLVEKGRWNGLNGFVECHDNSDFAIYDMDRYGVDVAVLLPSMLGTTNESQIAIMDKHPGRFVSCCSDGNTLIKYYQDRSKPYNFQEGLDEAEAALKTGRFCGVGEFVPGLNAALYRLIEPTIDERYDQWMGLCELGAKYDVPLHFHDGMLGVHRKGWENYDANAFVQKVCLANPKAKVVYNHGCKDVLGIPDDMSYDDAWKEFYTMAASLDNLYLECGGWSETNFRIAFECGMPAHRIMWGHDYGNVPQYLFREGHLKNVEVLHRGPFTRIDETWKYRATDSLFGGGYKGFPSVPTYQSDFYGWGMRTMDRVGDWMTQDEINLMMGGTAARLYKIPVPRSRMFPEARPDIFGDNWKEDWYPFLPDDQIMVHDYDADGNILRLPTDC